MPYAVTHTVLQEVLRVTCCRGVHTQPWRPWPQRAGNNLAATLPYPSNSVVQPNVPSLQVPVTPFFSLSLSTLTHQSVATEAFSSFNAQPNLLCVLRRVTALGPPAPPGSLTPPRYPPAPPRGPLPPGRLHRPPAALHPLHWPHRGAGGGAVVRQRSGAGSGGGVGGGGGDQQTEVDEVSSGRGQGGGL